MKKREIEMRPRVEQGTATMTFAEIARNLGYRDPENHGKKAVFMVYKTAMEKLKSRPILLRRLLELSQHRQQLIARKTVCR